MSSATLQGRTPAPRSAHSFAWQRRRDALLSFWSAFRSRKAGMAGLGLLALVVLVALLAPLIAPSHLLIATNTLDQPKLAPPSPAHPLGTDHLGRELWIRMVWGARISLVVGFAASAMSMFLGTFIGIAAGHFRGAAGGALMRLVDFFLVLPSLILAIVLSSVLSRGAFTIVIAIGLTSWAGTARVVRAQTLSVEANAYVERSRALGAGHLHIIVKHLLPGVMPLVLANTTLTVGSAIISESTLSFLGLGDTTQQSWGGILKNAMDISAATSGVWWYVLAPGVAIGIVVLAFTLVGRAFEAILNPLLEES